MSSPGHNELEFRGRFLILAFQRSPVIHQFSFRNRHPSLGQLLYLNGRHAECFIISGNIEGCQNIIISGDGLAPVWRHAIT